MTDTNKATEVVKLTSDQVEDFINVPDNSVYGDLFEKNTYICRDSESTYVLVDYDGTGFLANVWGSENAVSVPKRYLFSESHIYIEPAHVYINDISLAELYNADDITFSLTSADDTLTFEPLLEDTVRDPARERICVSLHCSLDPSKRTMSYFIYNDSNWDDSVTMAIKNKWIELLPVQVRMNSFTINLASK